MRKQIFSVYEMSIYEMSIYEMSIYEMSIYEMSIFEMSIYEMFTRTLKCYFYLFVYEMSILRTVHQ